MEADMDIPESVWQGSFKLFGVDVKCHVLSDGTRIIEEGSFVQLLSAMDDPDVPKSSFQIEQAFKGARGEKYL